MVKRFTAQIDEIIERNSEKLTALVRQSVQEIVDIAQTPSEKGGKMRVKTGFLRVSGQMSLTGLPSGTIRRDKDASYNYSDSTVVATLGKWQTGNTIYYGWTANYAVYREIYDGFLASALQNWSDIVEKNTGILKNE
jgi:hypothetical protein